MRIIVMVGFVLSMQGQELIIPGYECSDCHSTGAWKELGLTNFNHQDTQFSLEGSHLIAKCSDCHLGGTVQEKHQFSNVIKQCNSCHLDIHESQLGDQCEICHTSDSWLVKQQYFNHEETRFSLMGAHRFVNCQDCHDDLTQLNVTPSDCYSCHRGTYDETGNPAHLTAKISTDCQDCHEVSRSAWAPSTFDHDIKTLWPLTGAHKQTECSGCHQGIFAGINSDCWSCHQNDYEATGSGQYPNAPSHIQKNFNQDCEICHTTNTWLGAEVNHDLTAFPLTGSHQTTNCEQCHGINMTEYNLPVDCAGCHIPSGLASTDYTSSSYDHAEHYINDFCQSCHVTSSWQQTIFSHDTFTDESCLICHGPEYRGTVNPPHSNGNVGIDCEICHSTNNWTDGSFDHSQEQTGFILHGLHLPLSCQSCHVNDVYNGLSVNCESSGCHLSTFESTTNPNHADYGYPPEYCDECHNENGWEPNIFAHQLSLACMTCHLTNYHGAVNPVHNENIGFTTTCEDCHTSTTTWTGASFSHTGITTGCNTCHLENYNGTTDPNHVDLNFSTTCEDCHSSTTTWYGALFDHTGITDGCNACHIDNFNATTDPNHIDLNFSTTCEDCHTSTTTWAGAFFDHTGITAGCNACHLDNYNATTDPNHSAWGYPTTCEDCHNSTTDWSDANFSHSFPIAPNGHQDETNETCTSCHSNGDASSFTCFGSQCHSISGMVNEHCENGSGSCESCNGFTFPYTGVTSDDCYTCHPHGNENDCGGDGGDRSIRNQNKDSWKSIFLPD